MNDFKNNKNFPQAPKGNSPRARPRALPGAPIRNLRLLKAGFHSKGPRAQSWSSFLECMEFFYFHMTINSFLTS